MDSYPLSSIPHFSSILDKLSLYGLEEHIDDVIDLIYGRSYAEIRSKRGISGLSIQQVKSWILSLSFFGDYAQVLANRMEQECVDGQCLMNLKERTWVDELQLSYSHYYLLSIIFQGWKSGEECPSYCDWKRAVPIGLMVKALSDLSDLDVGTVQKMIAVDNLCAESGIGSHYGQLVMLGYKEYAPKKHETISLASPNEKFVLKRRKVSNGLEECRVQTFDAKDVHEGIFERSRKYIQFSSMGTTTAGSGSGGKVTLLEYKQSPLYDLFQVGRSAHSGNDFIVPGEVHLDEEGCMAGAVSRWACRIECERLPPFRSFIYAGGFEKGDRSVMQLNKEYSDDTQQIDGFSTFGLKIRHLEAVSWFEVSVRGKLYHPRTNYALPPTKPAYTQLGNQLVDGTIVDIGGVSFVFQTPNRMVQHPKINPIKVVGHLNSLKPHCPVLFSEICFTYSDSRQRTLQAWDNAARDGSLARFPRGVHVPVVDYSDLKEENRPYVYPACGHIFAYHKSIQCRPCPLCRKEGPFVPLAFNFEPAICDDLPTHVFNPCGHISSLKTCKYWSERLFYSSKDISNANKLVHTCPYCATELAGDVSRCTSGESFHKLGLHTETGEMWPQQTTNYMHDEEEPAHNVAVELDRSAVDELAALFPACREPEMLELLSSQQLLFHRNQQPSQLSTHSSSSGNYCTVQMQAAARLKSPFPKYMPQMKCLK